MSLTLKRSGFAELLKSPGVQRMLDNVAARTASRMGPGFEVRRSPGVNRARRTVGPQTYAAVRQVQRDPSALVRALIRSRG